MKKIIIIAGAFVLIFTIGIATFNSGKGAPGSEEGINELPLPAGDSLAKRGERLVKKAKYSKVDLEALKQYLNRK